MFFDPASHGFFLDCGRVVDDIAAMLRSEAGRNPHDNELTELVGELTTRSTEFTQRWAAHDVRFHRTGSKRIHHSVVGNIHLNFETMSLALDPEFILLVYTADPGSPSADALRVLASWVAAPESSPSETSPTVRRADAGD